MSDQRYLTAAEAAAYLRVSLRTLGERTRQNQVPYRRPAFTRRNLYLREELDAWVDGATDLEAISLPGNGVVCRFRPARSRS
jgi:excisionase family DNA binding protein